MVGSVAFDGSQEIIAATCPKGGRAAFWERRSGGYLGSRSHSDVCGVVSAGARGAMIFLLSSGNAGRRIAAIDSDVLTPIAGSGLDRWIWDNHMRLLLV